MGAIGACDQDRIIGAALVVRELEARRFILDYAPLNLRVLVGTTSLIRHNLQTPHAPGGKWIGAGEAARLVRSYCMLLSAWDSLRGLRAGTHRLIRMAGYGLDSLHYGTLAPGLSLCPTEAHAPVAHALAKHGIVTEAHTLAAQKINEMHMGWEPAEIGSKRIASLEQAILALYPVSSVLSVALAANRMRREIFSLPDGERTPAAFLELKRLISGIPAFSSGVAWCHTSHFERLARARFGERHPAFARNFVAGRGSPGAFPLFLRIGDKVITSHFFGELYLYALLPVLHKRAFDQETARRGKAYERIVQAHFEQRGFRYIPNVKKKGLLEIDGIAVSKGIAYVVEAKCWGPQRLIDDPVYLDIVEQKVCGAIDGVQHEHSTRKTKRTGVSLPLKVEWVRENRNQFGIGPNAEVKGLLVVNTASSVIEHSGCKVMFVDDLELGCV